MGYSILHGVNTKYSEGFCDLRLVLITGYGAQAGGYGEQRTKGNSFLRLFV